MATLDSIVNVAITRETRFPTGPGFGTPMLVGSHSEWTPGVRAKAYASTDEMITDGFDATHPLVAMATRLLSQPIRPASFVVGKRLLASTQVVELTIKVATEGFVYSFAVYDAAGVKYTITYTVLAAATTSTVATAIAALITALPDVAAAAVGAVITCTTDAGDLVRYSELPPIAVLGVKDVSADPGIATDLAAIKAYTDLNPALSWFGASFDHTSETIVEAAATWFEAQKLLFVYRTSDSGCADGAVTTDVMSDLQDSTYDHTGGIFAQYDTHDYRDAAWLGLMLPRQPGSATWAHKALNGIHVDNLTSGESAAIEAKNGTTYTEIAQVGDTYQGMVASGEFFDIIHGQLYLESQLQIRVFGTIISAPKLPYTQEGLEALGGAMTAVLSENVATGFIAEDPPFVVEVPRATAISAAQKATRQVTGLKFNATMSGAIHRANIVGTLSL